MINLTRIPSIACIITLFCVLYSCNVEKTKENVEQPIAESNDKLPYSLAESSGICFEVFDSTVTDKERFNQNNVIFKPGTELIYAYSYFDKNGKEYCFDDGSTGMTESGLWPLVPKPKINDHTFKYVSITVKKGLFIHTSQTPIDFYLLYSDKKKSETTSNTGIVENAKNTWIHPPRMSNFKILELNPFPFIKYPYKIGNKWTWTLGIGAQWGNVDWMTWEGEINNISEYEIVDFVKLSTKLGEITCYKIKSHAKSQLGTSSLIAYFNDKYGFVKLDYSNIDGSKIIFDLEEYYNTTYDLKQTVESEWY